MTEDEGLAHYWFDVQRKVDLESPPPPYEEDEMTDAELYAEGLIPIDHPRAHCCTQHLTARQKEHIRKAEETNK